GVAAGGDLVAKVDRRGFRERRLHEADGRRAVRLELRLEAVEEHVAARFRDVEQADRLAAEGSRALDAAPDRQVPLAGRLEKHTAHPRISRITGSLPIAPLAQPAIAIENKPAPPPQWTMRRPFGRNFGSVADANDSGAPSAIPPAPRTSSAPGICKSS